MSDARQILTPKYDLYRTREHISLVRDGMLLRAFPRQLKFQLDKVDPNENMSGQASFKKKVYGVFGYIKLAAYSYLIVIEEASLIAQILKANIYKVE